MRTTAQLGEITANKVASFLAQKFIITKNFSRFLQPSAEAFIMFATLTKCFTIAL
jgi:hypothetical protein